MVWTDACSWWLSLLNDFHRKLWLQILRIGVYALLLRNGMHRPNSKFYYHNKCTIRDQTNDLITIFRDFQSTLPSNSSWPPNTVYCLRLLIQAKIYRTIQRCKTRKIVRNRIYLKRFRFGLLSRHRFISAAGKRNQARKFARKRALPLFVPASQYQIVSNRPMREKTLDAEHHFSVHCCNL